MTTVNRQITLASRPVGLPKVSDFHLVYSPLPSPAAGEALVRAVYLSIDASTRGRMSEGGSAGPTLGIGEVMAGGAVGFVVASENPALRPGDAVVGMLGWQEYAVARADDLRKVDPGRAPLSTALGVLGVPGLTAFFALLEVCDPRRGETVVVSGAGDAVGMLAGQIAKIMGCRVVGLVGSDADAAWLEAELGFDAAFAPGSGSELDARLAELCPRGIDVYFDNVGGATTDAVMRRIGAKARIVVCAQSSQDNLEQPESGPRWLMRLLATQGRVQGFGVAAYSERFGEGLHHLGAWLGSGRLRYREDVAQGIAAAPQAFIGLLDGRSQGRQLVQLSEW